jgi:hypothetical protein
VKSLNDRMGILSMKNTAKFVFEQEQQQQQQQ